MKTTKTILAIIINERTNPIMKSKRIVSIILAIAMLLGITTTEKFTELTNIDLTASATGPIIFPDGLYSFRNKKSGKYIAVRTNPDGSSNYDAGVTQWDYNGYAGQMFYLRRISSNGAYFITPMSNQGTRLHLTGNVNANGTTVQTYYAGFDAYQMWWIFRNSDGSYRLVPTVSYTRTVNVRGSVYHNNTTLEIWDEIGSSSQHWYILSASYIKNLPIRIRYDSILSSYVKSKLDEYFVEATTAFATKYGIQFTLTDIAQSATLNGGTSGCLQSNGTYCVNNANTCGLNSNCETKHHKSAGRLNGLLRLSNTYTLRITEHVLCSNDTSTGHDRINGMAEVKGKDAIVSGFSSGYIVGTIQHEFSHILGVQGHCDNTTPSQPCVMKGSMANNRETDKWCSLCSAAIINNK